MTVWQKGLDICWLTNKRKIKPEIDNLKRELSRAGVNSHERMANAKDMERMCQKTKENTTPPHNRATGTGH